MMLYDINNIAFTVLGYPISYVELIATFFGFLSVFFASRTNILTWPTGIFNELFLFILFYQVQLYADMLLQVYFFIITIYGWYHWKQKSKSNEITFISITTKIYLIITIIVGTIISGYLFTNIHLYFPQYFKIKAAYPFVDSFVMIISIVATVLLAKKKIESWYLWIIVDIICIILFFKKGIIFLALEYFVFLLIAIYGLVNWKKQLQYE